MSSTQAIKYHSITIGDKNTWDDWHLVPTSRPKFNMPPLKTNYIDVPGADGLLDLSTALAGRPTYGNRQGSFEFLVLNEKLDGTSSYGYWADRYSEIATYLRGREFRAVLDDDTAYYYEGRFSVNEWKSEAHFSKIVIDYNVGPYKKTSLSAAELWLWDPFFFGDPDALFEQTSDVTPQSGKKYYYKDDGLYVHFDGEEFESGVIYFERITLEDQSDMGDEVRIYKNLMLNNSTLKVNYIGDIFQDTPVLTVSKYKDKDVSLTVELGTKSQSITKPGNHVLTKFVFNQGDNELTFTGTGVVTIQNTGGRL